MPPSHPPPLRLLERPRIRHGRARRVAAPPAPWWTPRGLRQLWRALRAPA
ncbi:MAG: hypothetical protein ACK57B_10045 [Betaproteobacteria bacterium]